MDSPKLIEVEFRGVHVVGPEAFTCALLVWREENRIIPLWLSPVDAAELGDRYLEEEGDRRRPGTHDLLADALSRYDGGVEQLALTSYFEGVFIGEITTAGGDEFDARPSDILILSELLDIPVLVDESVLLQASLRVNDAELGEYLGVESLGDTEADPGAEDVAELGPEVDDEFRQLLADLGMGEDGGAEDNGSDSDDDRG